MNNTGINNLHFNIPTNIKLSISNSCNLDKIRLVCNYYLSTFRYYTRLYLNYEGTFGFFLNLILRLISILNHVARNPIYGSKKLLVHYTLKYL